MATTNVVIDPVTRVEGHLRIQATATEVKNAAGKTLYHEVLAPGLSSSTMVRGIEQIMTGRDPRDTWAFAQRICGVCTVVHGLTSVRAVEQAIGVVVPKNAELIRNMMIGAQYVHDHVMHFYHLHALDWVDVVSALSANAANTAILAQGANPNHKPNKGALPDTKYFQDTIDKLTGLATTNQLGLFKNGYWGHSAYKLTPEQNLLLVSHYLEALGWAREVVKLHTVFGGRDPHPNMVVGGVPITLSVGTEGGTALNSTGFTVVQTAINTMKAFVDNVYLPDTLLLAGLNKGAPNYKTLPNYTDWVNYGATAGNFLCYGEFADANVGVVSSMNNDTLLIPNGVILNLAKDAMTATRQLDTTTKKAFNVLTDTSAVTENVEHAWYTYSGNLGPNKDLHPIVGQTVLNYTGPAPGTPASPGNANVYNLNTTDKYSWIKSPRWNQLPMEVGPLAHVLMMYARNTLATDKTVRTLIDTNWTSATTGLNLPLGKLNSTFGRIFSRTVETKVISDAMQGWYKALVTNKLAAYSTPTAFTKLNTRTGKEWSNGDVVGVGFTEAPRGALGHWVKISKSSGKVSQYQCIVASQWNAGPRDVAGVPGPYETALQGHRLADPTQPVEILRTIHSFDPCIGCAVHIVDPDGEPLVQVNVNHAYR